MKKFQQGFSVLATLLIFSFLITITLICWKNSSMLFDIEQEREKFYKRFYLAETLLSVGVEHLQKDFDDFFDRCMAKKNPGKLAYSINLDDNSIAGNLASSHTSLKSTGAKIFVVGGVENVDSKKLLVILELVECGAKSFSIKCILARHVDGESKSRFEIQNFTIGGVS
jgi:hypothetical protein